MRLNKFCLLHELKGSSVIKHVFCRRFDKYYFYTQNQSKTRIYIHKLYAAKTLYRKLETNIPRYETARSRSQFLHSCILEIYIFPRSVRLFFWNTQIGSFCSVLRMQLTQLLKAVERLLLLEGNPMSRVFQNIDPPTPFSAW
jgi:hypothetical protein